MTNKKDKDDSAQEYYKVLSGIDFTVPKGKLVAIIGTVGSGKSSLFFSLLQEMEKYDGTYAVNGTVAYVEQEAFVFADTFRNNLLFGRKNDPLRYEQVISVCALESDRKLLTDGDDTQIGEKGVNLSGGQKARICLGRALYSDADVYLLDDPLSAVDTKVGEVLFTDAIKSFLKGKTVLLITHQLHFAAQCDEIIVMDKGEIIMRGTYDEINSTRPDIFEKALNNDQKEDEEEEADEEDLELDELQLQMKKLRRKTSTKLRKTDGD